MAAVVRIEMLSNQLRDVSLRFFRTSWSLKEGGGEKVTSGILHIRLHFKGFASSSRSQLVTVEVLAGPCFWCSISYMVFLMLYFNSFSVAECV